MLYPEQLYLDDPQLQEAELLGIEQGESHGGSAALVSIAVTPSNPTFRPTAGTDRQQFTATGTYADGTMRDITSSVVWSSGTVATATHDAGGAFAAAAGAITSHAEATSVITATLGAISGNTTLTVDTAIDATKGWRFPSNDYQWSILGETAPDEYWTCQEAASPVVGQKGIRNLTASNTPLFQQADAGWARVAVSADDGQNEGLAWASGTVPDATLESLLMLSPMQIAAANPAAPRCLLGGISAVAGAGWGARMSTGGKLALIHNGVATNGTGASITGTAQMIGAQHDRAGNKTNAYCNVDKVVGAHVDVTADSAKGIFGFNGVLGASASKAFAAWLWRGANAEITTGAVKLRIEKLTKTQITGWS